MCERLLVGQAGLEEGPRSVVDRLGAEALCIFVCVYTYIYIYIYIYVYLVGRENDPIVFYIFLGPSVSSMFIVF